VTERDAFGNEIPSAPGAPRPEPAERAEPAEPSPPPPPPPRRGGGTAATILVVALIVAGVVALVVVGVGGKENTATSSSGAVITPQAPATTQEATAGHATPPKPASLLRARVLAAALARLHGRGALRILRVAPDRVDAQLVTRTGALRNVQVTNTGQLRDFGAAGSVAGLPTIPFAQVDTRAPARMVRAAAARSGRSPSRVDYLVLLMLPTGQSWNLYFKPDGLHFAGDRHGSSVVRR